MVVEVQVSASKIDPPVLAVENKTLNYVEGISNVAGRTIYILNVEEFFKK